MNIPKKGTKVHEHPLATLWFDEDGILHKISKKVPRTLESVSDLYTLIKRTTKGHKVCAMLEVSNETASNKEVLEYLKGEIPKIFKAVAFMATTPTGRMVGTITSILATWSIPTKVFESEAEASEWLKQYLHKC